MVEAYLNMRALLVFPPSRVGRPRDAKKLWRKAGAGAGAGLYGNGKGAARFPGRVFRTGLGGG